MTLRARIFIIVSLAVLAVLGVVLFLIVRSRPTTAPVTAVPAEENVIGKDNFQPVNLPATATLPATVSPHAATTEEAVKNYIRQQAKTFIERYGSYSSENNYDNIREVESLVTGSLWKTLSARLNVKPAGTFVGVTTRVFSTELTAYEKDKATVALKTVKTETKGETVNDYQQDATVNLVKSGDKWLVDGFEWK